MLDQRGLDDMTTLVEECFDWPAEYLRQVYNPTLLQTSGWFAWVGYEGAEPATTGQMVVDESTAGLYHVATTAKHRGKGYADANTRMCIEEARRQGCEMITLYASPMGYSVYKRIGFQDAGEYLTYGPQ